MLYGPGFQIRKILGTVVHLFFLLHLYIRSKGLHRLGKLITRSEISTIYKISIVWFEEHVHKDPCPWGDPLDAGHANQKLRSKRYCRRILDSPKRMFKRKPVLLWWPSVPLSGWSPFLQMCICIFWAQDPLWSLIYQLSDILAPICRQYFVLLDRDYLWAQDFPQRP